ncbi:MAG: hypothetical protein GY765_15135, partial [bacterium]|nr:hypothetical protein [bacterium]
MNEILIEDKFTRCPHCRSFSVKNSEISFKEKMHGYFAPASAHECSNCGYRFIEYQPLSAFIKNLLLQHKWVAAIPALLLAVVVGLFFLSGGDAKKPDNGDTPDKTGQSEIKSNDNNELKPDVTPPDQTDTQTDGKVEDKPDVKPPDQTDTQTDGKIEDKPDVKPPDQTDTQTDGRIEDKPETASIPVNELVIGKRNHFGVNWKSVENGVRIIRLSNGPMKVAGIKLGDILSEVDGTKITSGNYL